MIVRSGISSRIIRKHAHPRSDTAACSLSYRALFVWAADVAVSPALLDPAFHSEKPP